MKWALGLVAALMGGAISASANAAVILSLKGTVGDSSWFATGPGRYELVDSVSLTSFGATIFPDFTGSAGTFVTSGPEYSLRFNTSAILDDAASNDYYFIDGGDTINGSSFGQYGIVDEHALIFTEDEHSASFDLFSSSGITYYNNGSASNYSSISAPFGLDLTLDVTGKGGEPFSLVVFSSVPEPANWSFLILGFAAIGAGLRLSRQRRLASRRLFEKRSGFSAKVEPASKGRLS